MTNIKITGLCKKIKNRDVLININLDMQAGKIYGFVGKNGSGKTMLFRAIAGLIKPTGGEILFNNELRHENTKSAPSIGIVIENIGLYPELSGFKNLKFLASINKKINDTQIKDAIKKVGLEPEDKRPVRKYSLGMKQRIAIAQAIMESPDIILLDEPTNGLDEAGIILIRNIIKEEAERGALVAIASHNKEDIETLCDVKYQISNGEIREDTI
jgi:ABC-2 type transport system ATP-binding protein